MNNLIHIIIFFFALSINAQNNDNEIKHLERQRQILTENVRTLNDSIHRIDLKINSIKSQTLIKIATDSTLFGYARKGAKLKNNPDPIAEPIITFIEAKKVKILDYSDDFFGICSDSICGYMHELWIEKDEDINKFIKLKIEEKKQLKRLAIEREIKREIKEQTELDNKYQKKYGKVVYGRLKEGYYWIGMNQEMATISLGSPININRTVNKWGIYEQWVYENIYLYFENGKLTSYQN